MDRSLADKNLAVVRRLCEGWHVLTLDEFREIFDPQVDYRNIPIEGDRHIGPEDTHGVLSSFARKWDIRLQIDHLVGDDRIVMAERTEFFEHKGGLKPAFALPVMGTFELRDGRITAWRDYFELSHLRVR
jgi:limonene-1,2-epoxide hydrolase